MTRVLKNLGLLTKIDHAMFEAYCQSYSNWVKFSKLAQKTPIIKTPNNYYQVSPYTTLADKALHRLMAIASEFGLTPSARSRIKAEGPKESDELEKFLDE